jgi:hypothetical protein
MILIFLFLIVANNVGRQDNGNTKGVRNRIYVGYMEGTSAGKN